MNDIDKLRKDLKLYMIRNDLTTGAVAKQLNRHFQTIGQFLRGYTTPNERTLYKIRTLVASKTKKREERP